MELSPFTTLLRLQVGRSRTDPKSQQFRTLLLSVIEENQVLHSNESKLSLDVLVLSLQSCSDWSPSSAVYEFLDSCILRLIRKPVHYYDTFSNHVAAAGSGNTVNDVHIDLLVVAVEEQWSHLAENTNASIVTNVAIWVIRYFEYSSLRIMHEASAKGDGRAIKILVQIRDRLQIDTSHKTCCSMLKRSSREPSELDLSIASVIHTGISGNCHAVDEAIQTNEGHSKSLEDVMPPAPTQEQEDHFGLNRWAREDIQDAVTDGVIEELFLCLCSRYTEIRQQALTSIGTFMGKLEVRLPERLREARLHGLDIRIQRMAADLHCGWRAH